MEKSHLCLTWNDHGLTYQQQLADLRNENILTDVTLTCDGQKFIAHKLVLATCSDFFKFILGDAHCKHPIVYLRGVDGRVMQALLDFMYLGKIDFPKDDLNELLSTAQALQIKGLGVLGKDRRDAPEEPFSSKRKRSPERYNPVTQHQYNNSSRDYKGPIENGATAEPCYPASPKCSRRDEDNLLFKNFAQQPMQNSSFVNKENVTNYKENVTNYKENGSILSSIFNANPSHSTASIPNIPTEYHSSTSDLSINNSTHTLTTGTSTPETSTQQLLFHEQRGTLEQSQMNESNMHHNDNHRQQLKFGGDIKEEPLDCSQGSTLERIEVETHPLVSLTLQNTVNERDAGGGLSKVPPDTNQAESIGKLPRISSTQNSLPQDENLENGAEIGRPYACPICQKSFAKAAILKRHHLAHFRPYSCHLCQRSFTRREVLAEHVLEHNGADLRLPCPVCHMTIKRKRNLQAHIKVKHPEYYLQKSTNKEEAT